MPDAIPELDLTEMCTYSENVSWRVAGDKSFEVSSTNLRTLKFPAFQRYTLLLSPTVSRLEADQSIKLR